MGAQLRDSLCSDMLTREMEFKARNLGCSV